MATDAIDWIGKNERESWLSLRSIICVEAHRTEVSTSKHSIQKRYYLTTHEPDAAKLERLIRQHWSIENQCHWVLDVTWNEDGSRIRKGNAAENVALLRKLALNLLKSDTTMKDILRGKRLRTTLDENILTQFLLLKNPK